ncbi:thyroid peroxidase [Mytilus galloprovincialis]|uniref:Thyroid peroxidase n=1 Tax=Mytilus galloprovincialis TaxID=29158 RepID=A0A8B6GW05_MYTGA|nr:thyroid peroxidase [Mytilus galloprovincialis]
MASLTFLVLSWLFCNVIFQVQASCSTNAKYRTYDGSCNNLVYPSWGKANTAQRRFEYNGDLMIDYDDDNSPRGGFPSSLPSPRLISNTLMADELGPTDQASPTLSGQHFAFGQALTHDLIKTQLKRNLKCCENNDTDVCFPFDIPADDKDFTPGCRSFQRTERSPDVTDYREQINDVTSYIDCSHVYGSSDAQLATLRDTTDSSILKTSPGDNLPENVNGFCVKKDPVADFCQLTGDSRTDQAPSLQLNHLVLVREHNRIATLLKQINSEWENDRVFEETRRIVIAEMQHITYIEYLPAILSQKTMKKYQLEPKKQGFDDCYNDNIDASVRNAFAVAPFRMGHSQAMREQSLLEDDYKTITTELLADNFLAPHLIQTNMGENVEDFIRWLTFNPANKIDSFGVNAMRNKLFGGKIDLLSINIQRGRDQGTPSYNDWREFCGMERLKFKNFKVSNDIKNVLKKLYASADDIDLYVGGLLEMSKNGRVGETFACLIGKQFYLSKCGDRYWYERRDSDFGFSKAQLNSIKKMTMSKVLCENLGLDRIQREAFIRPKNKRKLKKCRNLPDLNLNLWKENSGGQQTY